MLVAELVPQIVEGFVVWAMDYVAESVFYFRCLPREWIQIVKGSLLV